MSKSIDLCLIDKCRSESTIKCDICQKRICNIHLKDHVDQCHAESLCLADDIDQAFERIDKFFTNESTFIKKLEEWRKQAYEAIDEFCRFKQNEYMSKINEEIDRSRETIASLSCDHDASEDYIDWAKNIIEIIHKQLDEFENNRLKFSPLKINDAFINIEYLRLDLTIHSSPPLRDLFNDSLSKFELNSDLNSFSPLGLNQVESEINSLFYFETPKQYLKLQSDNWYSLSSSNTKLLVSEKSSLYLIDRSLTIINRKSFLNIGIKDICWSKILSRFILITPKEIYALDEKLTSFELCPINSIDYYRWERGTCSNKTLFISTFGEDPIIIEYNLLPSIYLNRRWQSSIVCEENDIINDMKSNENYIGFIIENDIISTTRFEIRSIKSIELIYSIDLGNGWGYRCSNVYDTFWTIVDPYNYRLIQIINNGKNKKVYNYSAKPFNVTQWCQKQFAIRTTEHIYVHDYN